MLSICPWNRVSTQTASQMPYVPESTLDGTASNGAEVELCRAEGDPRLALGNITFESHPGGGHWTLVTAAYIHEDTHI